MTVIKVNKPGMYTTIQDLGRYNHQKSGMPVAGAMDAFSLKAANILAGNREGEACFEATLMGPELIFDCDTYIAVTGADFSPKVNGNDISLWSAVKILKGDVLSFGTVRSGCRCYIAVHGGIDVPVVMGSKSTYVRGKVGGFEGRILKAGDQIRLGNASVSFPYMSPLPQAFVPAYKNEVAARVVLGPQNDCFTEEGISTFLNSEYNVTNEADRMGYRLDGPKISHKNGADIISDGITMGSVQVPGHGSPIVMMADRQTTGGYTKIATVITPDIDYVGQLKPGDKLRFKSVSVSEAHEIYKQYMNRLESIKNFVSKSKDGVISTRTYKVRVNSKEYEVLVEEIR